MEEKLLFRKGTKEDRDEICELIFNGVREMVANGIYQWDEIYPNREDVEQDIEKDELYVGLSDGDIAVTFVINKDCDEQYDGGKWELDTENYKVIHRLCVHPKFQNRGFGKQTLVYIENNLREQGVSSIRLDAFPQNPYALKMYQSIGYHITGEVNFRKGRFYLMEKVITV